LHQLAKDQAYQSCIVHSADIGNSDAVRCAYQLGSQDMVKETGAFAQDDRRQF